MDWNRGNGFEVGLGDLVFSISSALDLMSPLVAGHHLRVSRIVRGVGRCLHLPPAEMRDILLAAALHDCGAFSLRERLDTMSFEVRHPEKHAAAGFRLLKAFPHFDRVADIIRFHHLSWEHGRGNQCAGLPVPSGSHLLHLADRVSVLPIGKDGAAWDGSAARTIQAGAGSRFVPELVEALLEAAARPTFWREVGASGDADLTEDPVLGTVTLTEADFRALARLFWQLVDYRSRFTATHTSGVAAVTAFLAPIAGITGAAARMLAIAAGLHDLGKIAVPSETLEKERALNREELAAMRQHPLHGWRILDRIRGMEEIKRWANFHHERLDGSGYPFHIPGSMIPLESRVVAVADVFTALTEERPYRRGMSGREAVDVLRNMADGGGLDHDVVDLMANNRAEAATIRRLAQEGASGRYLVFREHTQSAVHQYSAA